MIIIIVNKLTLNHANRRTCPEVLDQANLQKTCTILLHTKKIKFLSKQVGYEDLLKPLIKKNIYFKFLIIEKSKNWIEKYCKKNCD